MLQAELPWQSDGDFTIKRYAILRQGTTQIFLNAEILTTRLGSYQFLARSAKATTKKCRAHYLPGHCAEPRGVEVAVLVLAIPPNTTSAPTLPSSVSAEEAIRRRIAHKLCLCPMVCRHCRCTSCLQRCCQRSCHRVCMACGGCLGPAPL